MNKKYVTLKNFLIIYYTLLFRSIFLIIIILSYNCKSIIFKPKGTLVLENKSKDIRLLILPFQNIKSKEYSWVGIGLNESISTELSKIPEVITFTQEDRTRALSEIVNGQKGIINETTITNAGAFIGANYILYGKINISQSQISVYVKVTNVEKGITVKSFKVNGSLNNNGIHEIQQEILKNLIENFDEEDYADFNFIETPSTTAFENYSKGLELKNSDPKKSTYFFKKSIEEYPSYLSAMKELVTLSNSNKNYKDGSTYLGKYSNLIYENNLNNSRSHAELLYLEGESYFNKQEYQTSLNKLNQAEKILKNSSTQNSQLYAKVLFMSGQVYQKIGKKTDAFEKITLSKKLLERNLFTKIKFYSDVKSFIKDLNKSNVNIENNAPTEKSAEEYISIGLDYYSKERGELGRPYIIKGINNFKSQGDIQSAEKYENILQNLDNKTKF